MSLAQAVARFAAGLLGRDSAVVAALRPTYERLLVRLSGNRGLGWELNGVPCRIDPRARASLPRAYEAGAAGFLATHVRAGDLCFDIGAHIGAYVIQLAHWTRPTGRTVAFEPNPSAQEILWRHVRMNGLTARVELVPSAVGAESGVRTLHVLGTDGRSRLDAPNPEIAGRTHPLEVPVTTLDDFCRTRGLQPAWVVMDVEGFEIAVLRGARATLALEPRPRMVVELHPSVWTQSGTSRDEAEALLRKLRLTVVSLSGHRDPLGQHGLVYLSSNDRPR